MTRSVDAAARAEAESMQPPPYLIFSSVLMGLALAVVAVTRHRRVLLASGLIALPNAGLEIAFNDRYWTPTLAFGGALGLEDLLFSFSAGVLACAVALAPLRSGIESQAAPRDAIARWIAIEFLFLVVFVALLLSGTPVMSAALLGMCGVALALWRLSPTLVRLAVFGGAGFAILHVVALAAAFAVWPEWPSAWLPLGSSPSLWLTVFPQEMAWAVGFGAVHSWGAGYILNLRVLELEAETG